MTRSKSRIRALDRIGSKNYEYHDHQRVLKYYKNPLSYLQNAFNFTKIVQKYSGYVLKQEKA